jgi:pyruvate dehydrogenase E2 component (dihydrolipoamide acetyltransferase)
MAELVQLKVPDIGDFHDVPVIEVLVSAGDRIDKDAPLVTLESEKAAMEVPATSGGIVREISVKVGDKVSTGSLIASVEPAESAQAQAQPAKPAPNGEQKAPQPAHAATAETKAPAAPPATAQAATAAPPAQAALATPPSRNGGAASAPAGPVHASPAIRRFARELGVELGGVVGSGPNGRVTRDDVQSFVKRTLAAPAAARGGGIGLALPPWPVVDFAAFGPVERVALPRIRKISGPYLHRNWVSIPHVTQCDDADVTELEAFRKAVNGENRDAKVTMLAFVMVACVAALKRYPDFNSSLDGEELVLKRYYHIGFAADTPSGLVVPVLRDADRKGVLEIAAETAELARKAREGKLSPADMQGGTFTISSLGGIGGTYFTPIINAPEVAILGVCRAATRAVWTDGAFVPRLMLPLSLSYDHRVIDGAAAARFTAYLGVALADLRRTLL